MLGSALTFFPADFDGRATGIDNCPVPSPRTPHELTNSSGGGGAFCAVCRGSEWATPKSELTAEFTPTCPGLPARRGGPAQASPPGIKSGRAHKEMKRINSNQSGERAV